MSEPLAQRFMRELGWIFPFDHISLVFAETSLTYPYIGARPYRNITVGEYNADETRLWEEFGHNLAGAFGVEPPNKVLDPILASNSAAVTEMRAIFTTHHFCAGSGGNEHGALGRAPSGRYRRFVLFTSLSSGDDGSYQCTSGEHTFIYPFVEYRNLGDTFRRDAISDVHRGVHLLQRKYDWVKTYVYRGVEFHDGGVPCGDTGC